MFDEVAFVGRDHEVVTLRRAPQGRPLSLASSFSHRRIVMEIQTLPMITVWSPDRLTGSLDDWTADRLETPVSFIVRLLCFERRIAARRRSPQFHIFLRQIFDFHCMRLFRSLFRRPKLRSYLHTDVRRVELLFSTKNGQKLSSNKLPSQIAGFFARTHCINRGCGKGSLSTFQLRQPMRTTPSKRRNRSQRYS